jgi:hypothetical protein
MIFIVEKTNDDMIVKVQLFLAIEAESKDAILLEFNRVRDAKEKEYSEFRQWCQSSSKEEFQRDYEKKQVYPCFGFREIYFDLDSSFNVYTPEEFAAKMLDENLNLG